jgi:succinyldiaminopimelate transaminase
VRTLADRLPPFPWDRLAPYGRKADAHPGGRVDLSVGTPVDPVPAVVRRALIEAADWPGYPVTRGTEPLRAAALGWMERALGVPSGGGAESGPGTPGPGVLPVIGSKELVAALPTLLALGPGDRVAYPSPAYPTYEIGAVLCGAEPVAVPFGELPDARGGAPKLVWLNSPANPHGRVLDVAQLRAAVAWAREHGAVLAADECYIELGWDGTAPVSVLHPDVCDGDHTGLLALHSLSKRSNLAGYRAAFLAGDPELIKDLLLVRMHGGMIMPGPVQAAMTAALGDDAHALEQKERYRARRRTLRAALQSAGFRIEHSQAGLYLWATRDEPCWDSVGSLADLGILAAPGEIYGPAGADHVRIALTATDERVAAAAERLTR